MRSRVLLLAILACLGGCAQEAVLRHATPPLLSRVTLEFAPTAQAQAASDPRFDRDTLRDAIQAELRSRGLLPEPGQTAAGPVAMIQLDEFDVRATGNVVMFGYLPSAAVLAGTIRIRDASVAAPRESTVRTQITLNIPQRETGKDPLRKLYRAFARKIADDLLAMQGGTLDQSRAD